MWLKNTPLCYNNYRKQMHHIPISDIQFTISDQLFLDVLLMKIRSKTIAYARMKRKRKKQRKTKEQEEQLKEIIKPLEKIVQRPAEEKKKIRRLKSKLTEIRSKRMEGVLLRSRARWISEGEKVSKYFCSLEKKTFC